MPALKNVTKATAVAKVAYTKLYELLEDEGRINFYLGKAEALLKKLPGSAGEEYVEYVETARISILLVRDFMYKEYRDISMKNLALIAFGALYTISPIDLIPDTFGLIGLVDDAAVLNFVRKSVSGELDKYKEWRKSTGKDAPMVED
ncbi:MAG: DUF1232 domain-containing protein [Clostridia bacterium]|nr:DUF1232 domain-containing protein [Clostridia bacterium]